MTTKTFAVPTDGLRADVAVAEALGITRSAAEKLFESGLVTVGGTPIRKNTKLAAQVAVSVTVPDPVPAEAKPEAIALEIVYEDDDLLVVNKPKGMVVHPAAGHGSGTLVNALLAHCGDSLSGIGGVQRPGILHRIDKDTSGLLVVAKNDKAHAALAAQIKEHSFTRKYEAVVYGTFKEETGEVDAPIGRHPTKRKQMAVTDRGGKPARTLWRVLGQGKGFTHLELTLYTGRTHQIRVHMTYLGHPLAGDPVYGPKKVITSLDGQCLHARVLGFVHPATGEYMEFTSDLPPYFKQFLKSNEME